MGVGVRVPCHGLGLALGCRRPQLRIFDLQTLIGAGRLPRTQFKVQEARAGAKQTGLSTALYTSTRRIMRNHSRSDVCVWLRQGVGPKMLVWVWASAMAVGPLRAATHCAMQSREVEHSGSRMGGGNHTCTGRLVGCVWEGGSDITESHPSRPSSLPCVCRQTWTRCVH